MEDFGHSSDRGGSPGGDPSGDGGREALAAAYRAATPDHLRSRLREEDAPWELIKAAPGALILLDTDRRVLYWDEHAEELLGWREVDVLGEPVPWVPEPERADFRRLFEAVLEGRSIRGREEEVLRRDGSAVACELWARRIHAPGGELIGAAWVLLEVRKRREWQKRLQASERRYRELFESNVAATFRSRPDGTLVECNRAFAEMFGYEDPEELEGTDASELYPEREDREDYLERLRERGRLVNEELRLERRDGSPVWVLENSFLTEDPETGEEVNIGTLVDITDRKRTEEELRRSERRYRELFDHNVAATFRSRPDGTLVECNRAFAELFGYEDPEELEGTDASELYPDPEGRRGYVERLRERGKLVNEELRLERRDGSPVWVLENSLLTEDPETGEEVSLGTLVDITDRVELRRQLEEGRYLDPHTGLPNRRLLEIQARPMFALADRHGRTVAAAWMDLADVRAGGDREGEEWEEEVLRAVRSRLQAAARTADVVARVAPEEFVVVLPDVEEADAVTAARRVTAVFDSPLELGDRTRLLQPTTGIAVYPDDAETPEELLNSAARAKERAKARGGGMARYRPASEAMASPEEGFGEELEAALEAGRIVLEFQPIYRLSDGELVAAEALVRWDHPERGRLVASEFLPAAEASGMGQALDRYVLERAVGRLASGEPGGEGPPRVTVNLTGPSCRDPSVVRRLASTVGEAELADPSRLIVEVNAGKILEEPEVTLDILRDLSDHGVGVALEDFDTEEISLSQLADYPADWIKLSHGLTTQLEFEPKARQLAKTSVDLAHRFDLEVVGVGVETEDQLARLREAGCEMAQGNLLARSGEEGQGAGEEG